MDKKKKKRKVGLYIAGSVVLTACAMIVMPKIINCLSDQIYRPEQIPVRDDDDWGPEIVKREKSTDEAEDRQEKTKEEGERNG